MELHRQNQSRRLHNERRTQNAVPVGGAVARRCLRGIGRLSSWHVVAIDLHSVDVTDDAHAVKEHESDGSHARNSREVLAEVYGLDWREGGSDDGRRPGFIVEGEVFPLAAERGGVRPRDSLRNRSVERHVVGFLVAGHHECPQHDGFVDIGEGDPGGVGPDIIRVFEGECVDGSGGHGHTHFKRLYAVTVQRRRGVNDRSIGRERERLMRSIGPAGFPDADIGFVA